jgi:hypothetical protein
MEVLAAEQTQMALELSGSGVAVGRLASVLRFAEVDGATSEGATFLAAAREELARRKQDAARERDAPPGTICRKGETTMRVFYGELRVEPFEFTLAAETEEEALKALDKLLNSGDFKRKWDMPDKWELDSLHDIGPTSTAADYVVHEGKVMLLEDVDYQRKSGEVV